MKRRKGQGKQGKERELWLATVEVISLHTPERKLHHLDLHLLLLQKLISPWFLFLLKHFIFLSMSGFKTFFNFDDFIHQSESECCKSGGSKVYIHHSIFHRMEMGIAAKVMKCYSVTSKHPLYVPHPIFHFQLLRNRSHVCVGPCGERGESHGFGSDLQKCIFWVGICQGALR